MNKNIIPISGGKDSLATALLAKQRDTENTQRVFADTGNEHEITYDYLNYLETKLGPIQIVRADFTERMEGKRRFIEKHWRNHGVSESVIEQALSIIHPTGNTFLDLCLWKGRFPSTKRRFCSQHLKHEPIDEQVVDVALSDCSYEEVWSWQGVRAQESADRAMLSEIEEDEKRDGLITFRPILKWKHEDVFAIAKRHGIKPNPLYKEGMGRVGCMPCIHCGRAEMREIAKRFPEEIDRISEWEFIVHKAAKSVCPTFMDARVVQRYLGLPIISSENVNMLTTDSHGIHAYVRWANARRGEKVWHEDQDSFEFENEEDGIQCSSIYGLCE